MRNRTPFVVATIAAILFITVSDSRAAVLLDQSHFTPSADLIGLIGEGFPYVAQTVTPLGTGLLPRVEVWVNHQDSYSGNWTFSIRAVDGSGIPTGSILALQTVNSAQVHPNDFDFINPTVIDFSTPASITAGTPFAICVSPDPPVFGAGLEKGYWRGTTSSNAVHYAGGRTFHSLNGSTFTADNAGFDYLFRTYVDGVITPEPSLTLAVIFLALAVRRARV